MRAHVLLGGVSLSGTVESVDPRIENGIVRFFVTLDDPSDARLRNNQRVEVAVVTGTRSGVLVARRGALGRSAAAHAFVVREGAAHRTPVRFGLAGRDSIEIAAGLAEGDEVVISDMSDYDDVAKVKFD
jgi:HlyD family secretion protein